MWLMYHQSKYPIGDRKFNLLCHTLCIKKPWTTSSITFWWESLVTEKKADGTIITDTNCQHDHELHTPVTNQVPFQWALYFQRHTKSVIGEQINCPNVVRHSNTLHGRKSWSGGLQESWIIVSHKRLSKQSVYYHTNKTCARYVKL